MIAPVPANEIRPHIFVSATLFLKGDRFRKRLLPSCHALDFAEAAPWEYRLWADMHHEPGLAYWFGDVNEKNYVLRKQCLLEVELNMKAQGFCD